MRTPGAYRGSSKAGRRIEYWGAASTDASLVFAKSEALRNLAGNLYSKNDTDKNLSIDTNARQACSIFQLPGHQTEPNRSSLVRRQ